MNKNDENKNDDVTMVREVQVQYKGPRYRGDRMLGSNDVMRLINKLLPEDGRERVVAIHMDAKNRPMSWELVSSGGVSASMVDMRVVFRAAIVQGASALVLAHNHPSGDPTPSPEDFALTWRVVKSGQLLQVRVLDHVIRGDETGTSYSFLDHGMMEAE